MSSPIDDDSSDDRLRYAPPWARSEPSGDEQPGNDPPIAAVAVEQAPPSAPRDPSEPLPRVPSPAAASRAAPNHQSNPAPSGMAPPAGGAPVPWLRARAKPFEGDRAARVLRMRLALDPHLVPEPPEFSDPPVRWKSVLRIGGALMFAAAVALAVVLYVLPQVSKAPAAKPAGAMLEAGSAKSDRTGAPTQHTEPVKLALIESRRAALDEAVPLEVTVTGAGRDGAIQLSGLAAGARLTAGTPLGAAAWRVPLPSLSATQIVPPRGFAGTMKLTVGFVSADGSASDQSLMQIAWMPPAPTRAPESATAATTATPPPSSAPAAAPSPGPAAPAPPAPLTLEKNEIESLIARGRDFIANGDLASARLVLQRAANAGDAQAAFLLGTTFDPETFQRLRVIGSAPDATQARHWYQRAIALGSPEAARRLDPMARAR